MNVTASDIEKLFKLVNFRVYFNYQFNPNIVNNWYKRNVKMNKHQF